jgi:predicted NUDIX family NTP pyrophosphohydrolase
MEFYLAHPGGPFFAKKDDGAWTIPKGEFEPGENPLNEKTALARARKEFEEEIGFAPPEPGQVQYVDLGEITQKGGKIVRAWAFEAPAEFDDLKPVRSNMFEMEWPPKSERMQEFPEVDRAQFFGLETARRKINPTQSPFLDRLVSQVKPQMHADSHG